MSELKAIGFQLVTVANPETGEELDKVRVKFNNGMILNLFHPNHDMDKLKAEASALKDIVAIGETEYGKYAYIPNAIVKEEF